MQNTSITPESSLPSFVDTERTRSNKLVQALFEIINGTSLGDISKIDALVAEDYVQHNPLAGQGREGLRKFLYKIVPEPKELPPSESLYTNLIAEGDYVCAARDAQKWHASGYIPYPRRFSSGTLGRFQVLSRC